jgi:hypothetical protein
MSAEKQVPMIYRGGLSGLWWCATRYRENPDGSFEALEKHDVTGQIEEILTEVDAERIENDAWLDSEEGQASMARVQKRLGLDAGSPTLQRCYVHTFVTIDKCGCPPDPSLGGPMPEVSINDEKGYPCPKDGAVMTIVENGAWCPTCHTVWREIGEVDLADLDGSGGDT